MKGLGIGIAVIGLLIMAFALAMDTTVYSAGVPSIGGYGGIPASQTHNLGLMQQQELTFIGGCALLLVGAIVGAIGQLEAILTYRVGAILHAPAAPIHPDKPQLFNSADEAEGRAHWSTKPIYESDDIDSKKWIIGCIIMAIVATALVFVVAPKRSDITSSEMNAEMMADNLETQADALLNTVN